MLNDLRTDTGSRVSSGQILLRGRDNSVNGFLNEFLLLMGKGLRARVIIGQEATIAHINQKWRCGSFCD